MRWRAFPFWRRLSRPRACARHLSPAAHQPLPRRELARRHEDSQGLHQLVYSRSVREAARQPCAATTLWVDPRYTALGFPLRISGPDPINFVPDNPDCDYTTEMEPDQAQ